MQIMWVALNNWHALSERGTITLELPPARRRFLEVVFSNDSEHQSSLSAKTRKEDMKTLWFTCLKISDRFDESKLAENPSTGKCSSLDWTQNNTSSMIGVADSTLKELLRKIITYVTWGSSYGNYVKGIASYRKFFLYVDEMHVRSWTIE